MSELHCPNCDHLIGTIRVTSLDKGSAVEAVKAWMGITDWKTWEAPDVLYNRYRLWAEASGRNTLSQRRFSGALITAGAVFRSTKQGREYSRS